MSAARILTAQQQIPLDFQISAYDEARAFLDDSRTGFYAIVTKKADARVSQRMMPLHTLPFIIEQQTQNFERYRQLNGKTDTWISQAVFTGWKNANGDLLAFRRKTCMASISTLFCDLDYYNHPELNHLSPEAMADRVLAFCVSENLPLPSIIIDSGRGIQIKWYHQALPRQALPRWEACSTHLVNRFISLGSDTQVRDATRILRVLHTINQKSGQLVRTVWDNPNKQHTFNALCDAILPFTQEQIREFRLAAAQRKLLNQTEKSAVVNFACAKGFSQRTLNWNRLVDLQSLLKMRNYDMGDGLREPLAFYIANQYALAHQRHHADPNQHHEILRIIKDAHPHINHTQAVEKSTRLHKLMRDAATGVTKIYQGKEFSPLYTPTNETLINLFQITSQEQKHLSVIIDTSEKRRRNTESHQQSRRAAGVIARDEYEDAAKQRALKAKELKLQGLSQRAIAKELGVTQAAVNGYLRSDKCVSA